LVRGDKSIEERFKLKGQQLDTDFVGDIAKRNGLESRKNTGVVFFWD